MTKHILVHIDASPRAAARLALAQQLATQQGAELTALYGVLPGLLATPWAGEMVATMADQLVELDAEQRARAQAVVDQAAARSGQVVPRWVDGGSEPYWSLLQRAPYADLLVLGQPDSTDAAAGALPADLVPGALCDAGRPTLLVPSAGVFEARGRRVLIAWKPSREAARALTAALPWLRQADRIDVAMRSEGADGFDHEAALRHWFQVQGLRAHVQFHRPGPGDLCESLLSLVIDVASDLLVMGCYGHSRAREWVLGGATRDMLRTMTLPVLMAH